MTLTRKLIVPATLALTVMLPAGCGGFGNPFESVGNLPPPDEFAVIKRRPLEMPPALGLPEPRPGAPSPLDPTPERDAAVALLGADARPAASRQMTASEAALLQSANAASASNDVRVELALDEQSGRTNEPYEPPSVFELFGAESAADSKERLEPQAEARRLQESGVSAPSDPFAVPEEEGEPPRRVVIGEEPEEPFTVYKAPRKTSRP